MLLQVCLTLFFSFFLFGQEPTPFTDKELSYFAAPDDLIGGEINPLSGQPSLQITDLVAKGAQDICLSRTYLPSFIPEQFDKNKNRDQYLFIDNLKKLYRGWTYLPHLSLTIVQNKMQLTLPSGAILEFSGEGKDTRLTSSTLGISNFASSTPSGKYDYRNIRIYRKEKTYIIHYPDGIIREYRLKKNGSKKAYLTKEILPNGKKLIYFYNPSYRLIEIQSTDLEEQYVYASIKKEKIDSLHTVFTTNQGKQASFTFFQEEVSAEAKFKNTLPFGLGHGKCKLLLSTPLIFAEAKNQYYDLERSFYNKRFLLNSFYGAEKEFSCCYSSFSASNTDAECRVISLTLPQDTETKKASYFFAYKLPIPNESSGYTKVTKIDGTEVFYHINKKLQISSIVHKNAKKEILHRKKYKYLKNGWLSSIEERDPKKLIYRKEYLYDSWGNPIEEIFTGDLRGEGLIESVSTFRKFSQEGKNYLLEESSPKGIRKVFTYYQDTALPLTVFTYEKNKLAKRELYTYDSSYNLIRKQIDEGKDCTEKHITEFKLRQKQPFLHMPEEVTYRTSAGFVKKEHYTYDSSGNVTKKTVFATENSDKPFLTIEKTYDARGNLLAYKNPLGQEATYRYDKKNRCISYTDFSQNTTEEKKYDIQGNLLKKTLLGKNCIPKITLYSYNLLNQLTCKEENTHKTYYNYDAFEVTTTHPSVLIEENSFFPVLTTTCYDGLQRKILQIDSSLQKTYYDYNAYGSLTKIIYPNGAYETFLYDLAGRLIQHKQKDNLIINFAKDCQDRTVKKWYEKEEKCLGKETFTYNTFHLLSHKNQEGFVTEYTYDSAGRKKTESYEGKTKEYTYDFLDRVDTLIENDSIVTHYRYNLLDKIVEKKVTDKEGNLFFSEGYDYDSQGNLKKIIHGDSYHSYHHDAYNRLIQEEDALGVIATYTYDQIDFLDRIIHCDAKGTTTVTIKNVQGKTYTKKVFDADKTLLKKEEYYYTPFLSLLQHKESVYQKGVFLDTVLTKYEYNVFQERTCLIQAANTPLEKKTYYTYFPSGRLSSKTLPDNTKLYYTYTPFGKLQTRICSDNTIKDFFSYNSLGYLLYAKGLGASIERKVDPFGNVLEEKFSSGLFLQKSYDLFDRPLTLTYPDQVTVQYVYNPYYLQKVTIFSPQEKVLYTHSYNQYDCKGNLLMQTQDYLGSTHYTYDLRQRITSITSPYFSQELCYDPCDNVIQNRDNSLEYDPLCQLIKENTQEYSFDSKYNLRTNAEINLLDELQSLGPFRCTYDQKGNLTEKASKENTLHLQYDALHRIVGVVSEEIEDVYTYDPLGRRLSTKDRFFIYDGQEEIGAYSKDLKPLEKKFLGKNLFPHIPTTIAIEIHKTIYAASTDAHANICKLKSFWWGYDYTYTAFGKEKTGSFPDNPYRFFSKRQDATGLVYFGKRYYDPDLYRWLTPDPAGFSDSTNLYQFNYNNPYKYLDPQGENVLGFLLGMGCIALGGTVMTTGVALEIATLGGYSFIFGAHEAVGLSLMSIGCTYASYHAQDMSTSFTPTRYNPFRYTKTDTEETKDEKEPPYNGQDLGDDPEKCPGEGFEWRGKGTPSSGKGSWVKGERGGEMESLHPDLEHPPPKGPHWDYVGPEFPLGARLNPDGTWEPK